jgi:hypothetical protein
VMILLIIRFDFNYLPWLITLSQKRKSLIVQGDFGKIVTSKGLNYVF